ncbi:ATP-binding protein [Rhizobium ruizarguesonis]|uniref:ATP-binding protein n=1 Tax=Rhizobium TaxID=379 RepID=UPI001030F5F6|nr:ATP-binding protein [Rhizobium ruizarguesonis]TBC98999.1 ATP-binding protein [Rhizobium ruizarguesonis]TBE32879.1 ATP-binding protein [Rhizobium ruizarguesonis]
MQVDSVYQRRSRLSRHIAAGTVDHQILDELILAERAINEEAILWDFKSELPAVPDSRTDKKLVDAKFCEIMKDCVSFYNSFGGYLVAGVQNDGVLLGWSNEFDATDLNKRLHAATGANIETIYRKVTHAGITYGLLFVPRRPINSNPAQFTKGATENPQGRRAYNQGDFYFRMRDMCVPAKTPEDFEFLYGSRNVSGAVDYRSALENNLPVRDPDLGALRGREGEIASLWSWLADQFNPVHILCGLGGLGKTSLAYTFAERVTFNVLPAIDRVIWLGAKLSTFSGLKNDFVSLTRVDFSNIELLLLQILSEAGCPPQQIPEQPSRDELLRLVTEHLSAFKYLLIVDNVDTLPDEDQQLIFNLLTQICSMSRSKAVVTARRNLGASRAFYTEMEGLAGEAFEQLVSDKCKLLRIKPPTQPELEQLASASGGSPLFTLSALRLVSLGDGYRDAIRNWRGSDGEAVREAAFKTEISRLGPNEARILLALGYLQSASVSELGSVIKLNRYEIQKALEELQGFSMTTIDTSLPGGGVFRLPASLYLVTDLLEKRISDWRTIKSECTRLSDLRDNKIPYVGQAITRAVSLIRSGDSVGALEVASKASASLPDSPDLHCLMGRCLSENRKFPNAEDEYQKAFELGCKKRDLFEGWLDIKERAKDWRGVIDICDRAEEALRLCRYATARAAARMNVGDEFARAGRYPEASITYLSALDDIRKSFAKYLYAGDRANLKRLNETLVSRWIGSVQMEGEGRIDGHRRLFGAIFRATTYYRVWNARLVNLGLNAVDRWIGHLKSRAEISEKTREQLSATYDRLQKLRIEVTSRAQEYTSDLGDEIAKLLGKIEQLTVLP